MEYVYGSRVVIYIRMWESWLRELHLQPSAVDCLRLLFFVLDWHVRACYPTMVGTNVGPFLASDSFIKQPSPVDSLRLIFRHPSSFYF